jgi:glutamyl-tRNA synthetase
LFTIALTKDRFMTTTDQQPVRVRFAPSPTGRLHIGGARTAIYNWAYARSCGGSFILRIEDTDPTRSTDENTQIILRALRWLGLDWDEGPEVGGAYGPYCQTERLDTYAEALEQLKAQGSVYPCFCTKEDLDKKRQDAEKSGKAYAGYDRTCRSIDPAEAQRRIDAGEPHVWRLRVPLDHKPIEFDDAVYGHMKFPIDVMDDMILVRSDGSPTYNFAVVCDDAHMKITDVIRGDDHLSNTPRQILIYEALGFPVPRFAHLSMILGPDGHKLSKRHGATSVEEYRDRGYLPDALVNFLALLGWSLDGETTLISREKLCSSFSVDRITKKDAVFDETKLEWMNGCYIREMGADAWLTVARPWIIAAGAQESAIDQNPDWFKRIYPLVAERLNRFDELPDKISYLFWGATTHLDEKSIRKVLKKDGARADEVLKETRAILADTSIPWQCDPLQSRVKELVDSMGLKAKFIFQPIRVAVCGNMVSPPLFESIELLPRKDVLARIDQTLAEVFDA